MIVNLQRKLKIDSKEFRHFFDAALSAVSGTDLRTASVAFISDRRMIELNRFFRGKDSTTDVLSFPHEPDEFEIPGEGNTPNYLGDIVISVEQAQKQSRENGLPLDAEIKQLILHGLLHLCGYDHETDNGEMNKRELDLRRKLAI